MLFCNESNTAADVDALAGALEGIVTGDIAATYTRLPSGDYVPQGWDPGAIALPWVCSATMRRA
jgi:hypothetical protein